MVIFTTLIIVSPYEVYIGVYLYCSKIPTMPIRMYMVNTYIRNFKRS